MDDVASSDINAPCTHDLSNTSTSSSNTLQTEADLAAVIDAWPKLPEAVRAGIVAMVRAADGR